MDSRRLNLHPFETTSLSLGMALDEILFEETERTGTGFLRLSAFQPAGTTLGYFQASKNRDLGDPSWTRRPTGGGIVEHGRDLILSCSHVFPHGQASPGVKNMASQLYQQIHEAVRHALTKISGQISFNLALECAPCVTKPDQSYCFNSPVQYDICTPQGKIVGGALGRKRRAFLYQGSIQMVELLSNPEKRVFFQTHLLESLQNIWNASSNTPSFLPSLRTQAEALEKNKFLSPAWKGKY